MSMCTMDLERAIVEAERFIARAKVAIAVVREDIPDGIDFRNTWAPITGTKETAAVRRASMDLTRALAQLRKSR